MPDAKYTIRRALPRDAADILNIYSYYILNTAVSFETEIPSLEEFSERIRSFGSQYPYLVCESDGELLGYAYAHRHQQRMGYRFSAETTVYVAHEHTGEGIGSLLYTRLIDELRALPVRNLYAAVCVPNPGSEALHKKFGFHEAGHWSNTGYKFGVWRDIQWYELFLNEGEFLSDSSDF